MNENKYLYAPNPQFANIALDDLAVLSKDNSVYKEELYYQISNIIKIKTLSFIKQKYGDESDVHYNIFLASERAIKYYDKKNGSFLTYWNGCVDKSLFNEKIKIYYANKKKMENEVNLDLSLELIGGEEDKHNFSFELYNEIEKNITTYESILLLLYLAGYKYKEIEECVPSNNVKVMSTLKNIFVKLKKQFNGLTVWSIKW